MKNLFGSHSKQQDNACIQPMNFHAGSALVSDDRAKLVDETWVKAMDVGIKMANEAETIHTPELA